MQRKTVIFSIFLTRVFQTYILNKSYVKGVLCTKTLSQFRERLHHMRERSRQKERAISYLTRTFSHLMRGSL